MGYSTDFYGKLEFTRSLTIEELRKVEYVLEEPRKICEKAYKDYHAAFEASGRKWDNVRDNEEVTNAADRVLKEAGFVKVDWLGNARDMAITREGDGLVYRSEKSYEMVDGINFIIANAKRLIPDFGLKGQLYASTEFEPHQWLLKINDKGWAEQVPCKFDELPQDQRRVIDWGVEMQLRCWEESGQIFKAEDEALGAQNSRPMQRLSRWAKHALHL